MSLEKMCVTLKYNRSIVLTVANLYRKLKMSKFSCFIASVGNSSLIRHLYLCFKLGNHEENYDALEKESSPIKCQVFISIIGYNYLMNHQLEFFHTPAQF